MAKSKVDEEPVNEHNCREATSQDSSGPLHAPRKRTFIMGTSHSSLRSPQIVLNRQVLLKKSEDKIEQLDIETIHRMI